MKTEQLLSTKEAMKMLNIKSYNTLKKLWKEGEIKMAIIGSRPKILLSSIEEYIEKEDAMSLYLPEKKVNGLTICMTEIDGLNVSIGVDIDLSDAYQEGVYEESAMNPEPRLRHYAKEQLMDEDSLEEILNKAIEIFKKKLCENN